MQHILVDVPGNGDAVDLTQRWIPDRVYPLVPKGIIIHYDVCQTLDEQTGTLFASGKSYHVGIDGRDSDQVLPKVRQYVPFNRQGVHALGHNNEYLGVCIVNPGPVLPQPNGTFKDTNGRPWPTDQVTAGVHASGLAPKNWTHWATFSYEERDTVLDICKALVEAYPSIKTICGHDWISPGRKFDPGPAADFILDTLRGAFPDLNVPEVARKT